MAHIFIIKFVNGCAHAYMKHTRHHEGCKDISAQDNHVMRKKFGFSPFKNWRYLGEKYGGLK